MIARQRFSESSVFQGTYDPLSGFFRPLRPPTWIDVRTVRDVLHEHHMDDWLLENSPPRPYHRGFGILILMRGDVVCGQNNSAAKYLYAKPWLELFVVRWFGQGSPHGYSQGNVVETAFIGGACNTTLLAQGPKPRSLQAGQYSSGPTNMVSSPRPTSLSPCFCYSGQGARHHRPCISGFPLSLLNSASQPRTISPALAEKDAWRTMLAACVIITDHDLVPDCRREHILHQQSIIRALG